MRLTIATTSEKKVNARTSYSGMPDLSAMTKMAATSANVNAPCSRLQAISLTRTAIAPPSKLEWLAWSTRRA